MCAAFALSIGATLPAVAQTDAAAVVTNYADIAEAKYEDSFLAAQALGVAVAAFLATPTEQTHNDAKAAWLAARIPYQQSEVYRFGNPIVDAWEGRVNAWPLDEGLIDYVDVTYGSESDENSLYTANVIANPSIEIDGKPVDASSISPEFLATSLHEAGAIEANVATGYHAIEFLLWGQDLNGTGPGAGARAHTDFSLDACTNGNCDRRRDYLDAATRLLIADLAEMAGNWRSAGPARTTLMSDPQSSLSAILIGMGSLSYGELAGERMKLGLLLNDPEEEHDCFSDNTHNSHLYDALGIQNVYLGTYQRLDGSVIDGPSVSDLVTERDEALDSELKSKLLATMDTMRDMAKHAETVEAYDQMIGEGNTRGNAVVQAAIDALIDQTRSIERAIATLQLGTGELEGSDSLDNPQAVFE
ncbi:MAG: peptidase [Alphaproteobacteria bacterium]|nr:peptidase [Alphaproteobacteria bacterium]